MMFLLYNFLSTIALLFYLPKLLFKKGPEDRKKFLRERLGASRYAHTDIWVHAVSVGEVVASLSFLRLLKEEFPLFNIVLSTTTYTGQKIAREKFPEVQRIMYIPWDAEICIRRAVGVLKPKIFITIETELWPMLFKTLKDTGSYIAVLNGRISKESFKGYRLLKPFIRKVLSYVDFLYMQTYEDAQRIIELGADSKKVGVMGNFKFDYEPFFSPNLDLILNGNIFVAGSTHRGEEDIILDSFEEIKKTYPDLKLILAPRHPERFQEVEEILKRRNLNFIRRTEISQKSEVSRHMRLAEAGSQSPQATRRGGKSDNPPLPPFTKGGDGEITGHRAETFTLPDIILLDTIGELSEIYRRATIAFVGGSLLPYGGHNILEPAYWSKAIIFGPHMDNFPIAEEFLRGGGALTVKNSEDIVSTVRDLLKDPERAKDIGQRAKIITENNRGAVKKALELIRRFLSQ